MASKNIKTLRYCGYCAHAFIGKVNGRVHCGHGVDDAALKNGEPGKNPIWAERKYGSLNIITGLAGSTKQLDNGGTDCENMAFADGATCKVWKQADPNEARRKGV